MLAKLSIISQAIPLEATRVEEWFLFIANPECTVVTTAQTEFGYTNTYIAVVHMFSMFSFLPSSTRVTRLATWKGTEIVGQGAPAGCPHCSSAVLSMR